MSKKKHILLVVENLSVPFDRRVWREARALKHNGYDVSVISPKGENQDKESRAILEGVEIYRYEIPLSQDSKFGYVKEYFKAFLATFFLYIRITFKQKVDAIHVANPPEIFFPLGWVRKIFGFKFIFDQHDLSPETFFYKFENDTENKIFKALLFCEAQTYKSADLVIATNQSIQKIAIERGNCNPENIVIVRNGPDKDFQPVPKNEGLKKDKEYLAAYVGVMGTQDGVENIILAANYLINECNVKDIHYILIGYGDEYDNHLNFVKKLKLENYIEMPGRIPDKDVLEILSSADVCLAPDPVNGLNEFHTMNKIMDYMRCGKPIVSFDLAETIFSAEKAAVYIPDNDIKKFAKAIIELLKKPELRKEMGEFGKNKVEKELKWEFSVQNLLKGYKKVLQ